MQKKKKVIKKFSKRMQKKLVIVFAFITVALAGLIVRLMYIEHTSGNKYKKIVLSQQEYDSRIIPYQRGNIVDAKGTVLATSVDVYNVVLDCKVLSKNKEDIDATISALTKCFTDLDSDKLYGYLKDDPTNQYRVLAKKLPYETVQPFVEMQADEKKYPNVNNDAVWFEKEYVRNYPYGSTAASLIGFVSSGNVGTVGLENYYNSTLNGVNGRQYGYLNSDNNFEKTIKQAKDGSNIVSTIDVNIQSIVEEKILKFNQENANAFTEGDGSKSTAAIVMNPNNGEILAMANYPTFDLNNPRDLSAYYTEEELQGYDEKGKMDLLNGIWENFCITHSFEPGSTVKPMTIAAGLETGTLTGNESYYCDGLETVNGTEVHCVKRVGHGMETIQQSIMFSCNDALMQMSYAIGVDNFTNYQSIFGFGQKTNIDLPGEALTEGLIYTKEKMSPLDLATSSFGQTFNTSMIQVASAFSSVINGGKYYKPHVVKKIQDAQGNTIENIEPVLLKNTISKETSDTLKSYLYPTVCDETGTGKTAKVPGYSMGGKTGTAQKTPRADKKYLVSFIGYLPEENPEIVIYVVVDEPNAEKQANSIYAQNITREILTDILPYLNIYPDMELTPKETAEAEAAAKANEAANTGGTPNTGEAAGTQEGAGAGETTGTGENAGAGEPGTGTGNAGTAEGTTGQGAGAGEEAANAGEGTNQGGAQEPTPDAGGEEDIVDIF